MTENAVRVRGKDRKGIRDATSKETIAERLP
jgi:hypothetical protein